jgi:RNA polymerase sigma factor (sigma-70 family)
VQQVFLAVHRSLPNFDPARPLKPWLKTITLRTLRDYAALGYNKNEQLTLDDHEHAPDPRPSAEALMAMTAEVRELLASLNDKERLVLRCVLDDTPIEALAEDLGLSESGASGLLRRTLEKLARAAQRHMATERRQLGRSGGFLLPLGLDALSGHSLLAALALRAHAWAERARAALDLAGKALGRALARMGATPASLGAGAGLVLVLGASLAPPSSPGALVNDPASKGAMVAAWASAPPPAIGAAVSPIGAAALRPSTTTTPSTSASQPDQVAVERQSLQRIRAMVKTDPTAARAALDVHKATFPREQLRFAREGIEALVQVRTKVGVQRRAHR